MSKKILVVEDEKNIAELERDYLEANGYTVEIEFDGKNGLDKAIGSDYIVVGRPITQAEDPVAAYRRCVSEFVG